MPDVRGLVDVLPSVMSLVGVPGTSDRLRLRERLGDVDRIAVLLVDGLGYHLLRDAAPQAPLLADVVAGRAGVLDELGSPFPSTTPTSLVTLGTGALPGAHGIVGFTVNVPDTDRLLTHIVWGDDPDPAVWQPVPTLFQRAAAAGVRTTVVARSAFEGSGLTRAAYDGAAFVGADRSEDLARAIVEQLAAGPGLVYGYHPTLDTEAHLHGIDSPEWRRAAASVDRLITRVAEGLPPGAALVVTADHGGLDVPADARIDAGTDPRLLAGVRVLAGEPRVRYVHTLPGAAEDVRAAWQSVLGEAAHVLRRDEAIGAGLFGPVPPEHLQRIGDLVVVCRERFVVLASGFDPDMVAKLVAFHGSTAPVETAVPLVLLTRR